MYCERIWFFYQKLIESNHQPALLQQYFMEAVLHIQTKFSSSTKYHTSLTNTKKNDEYLENMHKKGLVAVTILPTVDLIAFV